ncbi:MAG: hypothetical protein GWN00_30115, partial [Aliifodinibius sp.]|nr:hypothetical protein [Phycisphaerae bacterium]NIT60311.1 hypothetical protein [Fodinibius sp.]NIY28893.1 hypothetical protein [Fodinibius sp.]
MTNKALISLAFEEGHFYGLVDEGEYLRQSLFYKQILPRTPSRLKTICVNPFILSNFSSCSSWLRGEKIGVISVNPWFIKDLRLFKVLYICRDTFTDVMSALQIELFMQNKAKFQKSQVNVTDLLTREYVQMDTWSIRKKQSQTKPNKPKTNPILANKTP